MKSSDIPSFFRLARNVSKLSDHRYKLGAVVVTNGKPIAVGHNQTKTNPCAKWVGLHAEEQAIKACGKANLSGSSIYVYRQKKNGSLAIARPCEHCMQILKDSGVKWIYYTTSEFPFWEVEKIA